MGFKKRETETDLLNERRIIDNLVIDYFDGRKFRKWKDYGAGDYISDPDEMILIEIKCLDYDRYKSGGEYRFPVVYLEFGKFVKMLYFAKDHPKAAYFCPCFRDESLIIRIDFDFLERYKVHKFKRKDRDESYIVMEIRSDDFKIMGETPRLLQSENWRRKNG